MKLNRKPFCKTKKKLIGKVFSICVCLFIDFAFITDNQPIFVIIFSIKTEKFNVTSFRLKRVGETPPQSGQKIGSNQIRF